MLGKYSNKSRFPKPLIGLFFIAMAALFVFLLGNVIMYLWNTVLVEVTAVKAITFWQGIGIFVLARILFGGFKSGHRKKDWKNKRRSKMREKWMGMSDEERSAMKENWKDWCNKKD